MHETLHLIARLAAVAIAGQFIAAMVLYFRVGRQRVEDAVLLALALATLLINAWLCSRDSSEATTTMIGAALVLMALASHGFWRAVAPKKPETITMGRLDSVALAVARLRPLGFASHPFYRSYSVALLAFALLGGHSIQYVTGVMMAIALDRVARAEGSLALMPADLAFYYRERLLKSWESTDLPRFVCALRSVPLLIRRVRAKSEPTVGVDLMSVDEHAVQQHRS